MKNNITTAFTHGPDQTKESLATGLHSEWLPGVSWMEFEDSFIQLLSGAEPVKKYFNHIDIHQQITC